MDCGVVIRLKKKSGKRNKKKKKQLILHTCTFELAMHTIGS
jgi:hypothetical protein